MVRDLDDTAARLVLAAERLFAEGGAEATSLRAIARAAHANPAAVHYHFSGRDELVRAVLARQLGPLNQRRLQALDALVGAGRPPAPVEALVTAAFRPDLELLAKLRKHRVEVARFLGRAHTLPSVVVARFMAEQFDLLADRLVPLLSASLPELPAAELRQRLGLVMFALAAIFATAPEPGQPGPLGSNDIAEQVARFGAFGAGALSAPALAPTADAIPAGKRKKR